MRKAMKLFALLLSILMMISFTACEVTTGTDSGDTPAPDTAADNGDTDSDPVDDGGSDTDSGSGEGGGDFSGTTLEIAVTYTGPQLEAFQGIVRSFEADTGATVNVSEYGDDYEATMKTRMASNQLPDLFQTHGWSILRYKEYLMPLNDQPWISDLDESALGVIEDDDGTIYVLMISELVNATLVNLDICEEAGVDPYAIETWQDFTEACQKIKDAGYTPIGSASGPGLTANIAGTWVSYEGEQAEDSDAMLDGTWDWQSYRPLLEAYRDWLEAGFFYDDAMTMADSDLVERWANNQAGFQIGNDPGVLISALELNPEGNYAFLPTFASKAGGKQFVGIGEGDTMGIWKGTANEEAAKAFLIHMANADNALAVNNITGKISSLKSAMAMDESYGLKVFMEMQDKYGAGNVFYENLWDRKYMPSGMWGIFGNACNMLFDDHSEAGIDACIQYLRENYEDLYEAAQEQ